MTTIHDRPPYGSRFRLAILALIIGTGLVLIALSAIAKAQMPGMGHPETGPDPYSGLRDPVYHDLCCGRSDCSRVPAHWITPQRGGYWVRLSVAEAQLVNPKATAGIDTFVPQERTIESTDGSYHLCIGGGQWRQPPKRGVLCILTPAMS